jgi:hypothetical protein
VFIVLLLAVSGAVLLPLVADSSRCGRRADLTARHHAGGTRIEETERYFSRVEEAIRKVIPEHDRDATRQHRRAATHQPGRHRERHPERPTAKSW